jgi:hypothetical protein
MSPPISRRFLTRMLLGLAALGALLFGLSYQVPGTDQHPSWQQLPRVTNARFVVEELDELVFDKQYGHRFSLPEKWHAMTQDYADRLHNIRLLGHQVTYNEFEFGHGLSYNAGSGAGLASTGSVDPHPTPTWQFVQRGYTYFELTLGREKAYFKDSYYSPFSPLQFFYQYNYPQLERDTLFFYCTPNNYRVYLR